MEKNQPILTSYIKDRIENKNKNFVILFVGATGSGKSYAALKLAELLDKNFSIDMCAFKARDFMNIINNLVKRSEEGEEIKGRVILWDEFGVEHSAREFMTISNRVINYFFQTSRHLNLIVIMTVPLLSFVDSATRKLCHAVAEMGGINSKDKTSNVKIKMLQTNVISGKEYPKYLRYRRNNKSYVSKKVKFNLPSEQLAQAYELKKKQFTTGLNKEIMEKLLNSENKDKGKKELTDNQKKVAELLTKKDVEKTAKEMGVTERSIYAYKTSIENKGYKIKPIWENKKIIAHNIEGLNDN